MRASEFRTLSETEKSLYVTLASVLGVDPIVDRNGPEIGIIDINTGDIVGAGETLDEALDNALNQCEEWGLR
jgi:hypothetical protein